MTKENKTSAGRLTGASLRTAAALLENPITRPLLVGTAYKRLKLPLLRQLVLPPEAGLYTHRHMARPPVEDAKTGEDRS